VENLDLRRRLKWIRVKPAIRRFVVKVAERVITILEAIVLASLSACDGTPRVATPVEAKPGAMTNVPERIVFVSDSETSPARQIYTMRCDGTGRTRISRDLNNYVNPMFSPDGNTILACTNTPDGSNEIYSMSADGSGLRNLSNSMGDDDAASYSQDGSKIVFTSTRDGNSEIYIMNSRGENQTRLTFSDLIDHAPQFGPGGSRIWYCSTKIDPKGSYSYETDIYVMNTDGSNKTCLTAESGCHFYAPLLARESWFRLDNHYPGISSDGSKILFSSYHVNSDNNWVLIMDSDGNNRRVVYTGDLIFNPLFAPGDSMIVFLTHRDGKYDLYEMALDGTRQRKLTRGTPGHVRFSQFSPDGSAILFSTDVGSYMTGSYETIWSMNLNGSVQTQLTFGGANDDFPHFQPVRK
jgi:Tol biopolymer transport system component